MTIARHVSVDSDVTEDIQYAAPIGFPWLADDSPSVELDAQADI